MPIIECEHHKGHRGAERVSFPLNRIVMDRSKWRMGLQVVKVDLFREEGIEFTVYWLESDLPELVEIGGVRDEHGVYQFSDDDSMERAMGLVTVTCSACLTEFLAMLAAGEGSTI